MTEDQPNEFAKWLAANPEPSLHELVDRAGRRYAASIGEIYDENPFTRPPHQGGYPHITPQEWADTIAQWRSGSSATASVEDSPDPDLHPEIRCRRLGRPFFATGPTLEPHASPTVG